MKRRLRASIGTKLIALTAMLIAAIVGFLTAYFPSQQIETMRDEQLARVGAYGQLLSVQARSAVAFSDHETAREVLTSLDADRDVVAAALFVEDGEALYIHGTPSKWITRARHGVVERRVVQFEDRVAVVEPVQSLEGPRGTLVIELSMARFQAHQETVIATAIAVGGTVLLFGVLVMWLIARSLSRRLRAINDIATTVATGSTENTEAHVDSDDEIGRLAQGFNFMLAQVRADQRSLQVTVQDLRVAEDELAQTNRELEQRVSLKTQSLVDANAQLHTEMARRTQIE
ncbi:MAG: HAMP domain-containing protein, partial [Kofleriaceae bacterium]